MKRAYTSPMAEKVQFQYQEQVVASNCIDVWVNIGYASCTEENAHYEKYGNQ